MPGHFYLVSDRWGMKVGAIGPRHGPVGPYIGRACRVSVTLQGHAKGVDQPCCTGRSGRQTTGEYLPGGELIRQVSGVPWYPTGIRGCGLIGAVLRGGLGCLALKLLTRSWHSKRRRPEF